MREMADVDVEGDLPDMVDISQNQLDRIWDTWLMWLGTDRRFLPAVGGLEDQPIETMTLLFRLDALYNKITMAVMAEKQKERDKE